MGLHFVKPRVIVPYFYPIDIIAFYMQAQAADHASERRELGPGLRLKDFANE
jgi:hypothetical protein